ncbi:MAG: glycosyltransferase family 2 protein [Enterococcus sp.]
MKILMYSCEGCRKLKLPKQIIDNLLVKKIVQTSYRYELVDPIVAREKLDSFWECEKRIPDEKSVLAVEPNYDLQIIIPVYNAENEIEQCVDSILQQQGNYTYKVILIDDGSRDGSLAKIKQYEQYPNFEIATQENRGVSATRNAGLKKIDAKYLYFVDADDYLPPNAIEVLLDRAYAEDLDIVQGSYFAFENDKPKRAIKQEVRVGDGLEILNGFPWGKVFKASLFENIKFPTGLWFEDTVLSLYVYPGTKVATISEPTYNYRLNQGGITVSSKGNPKVMDSFWVTQLLVEGLVQEKKSVIYDTFIYQLSHNLRRTHWLPLDQQIALFVLSRELLLKHFQSPEIKLKDSNLASFEQAVINNDFISYVINGMFIKRGLSR